MKSAKSVDEFFSEATHWRSELARLRKIVCSTGLTEEIKWGGPCYTHNGKNVVGIGAFKSYFGLWFHQGALLDDKNSVLINAQEGKTKALRQWQMTAAREIKPTVIKRYISQAVAVADEGRSVKPDRNKPIILPPELKSKFQANKSAAAAFKKLRPGQQREYAEYVSDAKRPETRLRRIEKVLPMIAAGSGLNDKYR